MCVCVCVCVRERERGTNSFWSSSISSFFWHPVVGFAMLNCKTKKNLTVSFYVFVCVRERKRERERTFMLDVREWGGVEQMRLQMKMTQKEEARLLGFCMMRFGEMPCVFFFFFFFGFWVFSQTNGTKAQTLTNGVWLLERSDLNSRLSPFKDPSPISAVASPVG